MELKFRAWNKERKLYYKVTRLDFREYLVEFYNHLDYVYERIDTNEVIIEQYTGLKDKSGVEIYEGDVLFHPLQGRRKVYYPYSETAASYGLRDIDNGMGCTLQDSHAVWEVIGNIHENKELLK